MATRVREVERKYDAGGTAMPALDHVDGVAAVSPPAEDELDAVYYDTDDLRLIRAGVTLRKRTGGDDAGWHLKLPVGADTRDEIRLPLTEPAGQVPDELAALVRVRTRGAPLRAVVHMRTIRRRRWLLDDAGQRLAEIASDAVWADPMNGSAPVTWEEIEVELAAGGSELLEAVDARLRDAGARPATTATKLERALGDLLRVAQRGRRQAPAWERQPLTSRSAAGDVVLAYLAKQVRAITDFDPRVRRDEPDSVHQMRVATRRARSALQAFKRILSWEQTQALCDELKWLATVLGQARDAEVLLARFTGQLDAIAPHLVVGPIRGRITAHFTAELSAARQAALHELDGARYFTLLDDLDALLARPPLTGRAARPAGKVLATPVKRAAQRLERALAHAAALDRGQGGQDDMDTAIHEARKAAKRVRYAAEAAMPALGGAARRLSRRTKKLQELLGEHHDNVVARTILRDIASEAHAAGEDTFTYGVLYERDACEALRIERSLLKPGRTVR
ncbi:MAG: CHAD domain-containing protein [Micromonosporaceae bacterium]